VLIISFFSTNFLEYYGIAGVVPMRWEKLLSEYGSLHDIKNNIIDRFKTAKNHANIFINCISIITIFYNNKKIAISFNI
jgi:hypothetical protein